MVHILSAMKMKGDVIVVLPLPMMTMTMMMMMMTMSMVSSCCTAEPAVGYPDLPALDPLLTLVP